MQTKKQILLRKPCLSFLAEDDNCYYIMKSGHTNPQNYVVIQDTPYELPSMRNMTLSELVEFLGIGVSEMAIEIGLA